MATNLRRRKISVFSGPTFIVAMPFRSGLEYWNADGQVRSALNVAISYTKFVRFRSVTQEFCLLIFVLGVKNGKNRHIWPIISEHAN